MSSPEDRSEKVDVVHAQPYVRLTLTLVGNMNDLLAGSGTQEADAGVCAANSLENDPSCV